MPIVEMRADKLRPGMIAYHIGGLEIFAIKRIDRISFGEGLTFFELYTTLERFTFAFPNDIITVMLPEKKDQ